VPEVCEQSSHAATLRLQRWKISERVYVIEFVVRFHRLRLFTAFMRLPLGDR